MRSPATAVPFFPEPQGQEIAPLLIPQSFLSQLGHGTHVCDVNSTSSKQTLQLHRLEGQSSFCSMCCGFPRQSFQPAVHRHVRRWNDLKGLSATAWSVLEFHRALPGSNETALPRSCPSVSTYPSLSNLARRCCRFVLRTPRACLHRTASCLLAGTTFSTTSTTACGWSPIVFPASCSRKKAEGLVCTLGPLRTFGARSQHTDPCRFSHGTFSLKGRLV